MTSLSQLGKEKPIKLTMMGWKKKQFYGGCHEEKAKHVPEEEEARGRRNRASTARKNEAALNLL